MNWQGNCGAGGWIGDPVTNAPNTAPVYPYTPPNPYIAPNHPYQPMTPPGSLGFGMDPNPLFTAAINRLAAAIEALAAKPEGK